MPSNNPMQPSPSTITNKTAAHTPLAPVYAGNDGGAYYVTQVGEKVYWFAEHPGRDYAHVFHGTREGDVIKGRFHSVPKDKATTLGQVTLKIRPNGSLERVSETGGFPSKAFGAVSMDAIVGKLPGKAKYAGFTGNTLADLDGVFDDDSHRCYLRQIGELVVFFAEDDFKKGERPERAIVFVGERSGNTVKGEWIAVPKGKKKGSGTLGMSLQPNRSLVKAAGSPLGTSLFAPFLPEIAVPIATVMELANTQLNKIEIRLDGHASGKAPLKDGSYVKLGSVIKKFTMPHHDRFTYRYFINDMTSDVIHAKPIGENETRLSIVFEDKGREIKRVDRLVGDGVARDWDIENPRCDIYVKLINHKTSDGRPSISYEVTNVDFLGELDAPGLIESIDDWITSKVRPRIESSVMQLLNQDGFQVIVANEVQRGLDALVKAASEYSLFGYSPAALVPKHVAISGNKVVFRFI